APPHLHRHHAAHAEDERDDALRLAHLSGAQLLDRRDHDVLHEIEGCLVVAQVPAPVEAYARGEAAVELGLGPRVDTGCRLGNASRKIALHPEIISGPSRRMCNDPAPRYTSSMSSTTSYPRRRVSNHTTMITNTETGTNIQEIAPLIFRINTPVDLPGTPFSFNQYLIAADEPLLFHTGHRKMFPLVAEAIAQVMPLERLRHVGFSHFEADECGALNDFLDAAPNA